VEIQPIVIGTAGHIDHGKSSLVHALTGIHPDRLKEEQERGLTIDLGFARMRLPDGRTVGWIDVPGHERFIRNMVAGASGIDLVVLVVAADDGVMPQTREHLDIMGLLGLKRGVIALNKVDLVEPDWADLTELDVREAVAGTFLEKAPLVRVSAVTGQGLDQLKAVLAELAREPSARPASGLFRLPIQRVFSAKGFGTVVTGVPLSGQVEVGQVLELLPSGQKGKVRGIQAYGESAARARAGHSCALNLSDVDHHHVTRGHVAATPGFFRAVMMVAARLTVLKSAKLSVADRMHVRLHTGTADPAGTLVLLDHRQIEPGQTGLVQVRLDEPLVCAPGDPFVLRLVSPAVTLGGGRIIEESEHRLKRFKGFVIEELSRQEESLDDAERLLESLLLRRGLEPAGAQELSRLSKRSLEETSALLGRLARRKAAVDLGAGRGWLGSEVLETGLARVRAALEQHFREQSHRTQVEILALRGMLRLEAATLDALLAELARRGEIRLEAGGLVAPIGRTVQLDARTAALREGVLRALEQGAFQPPSPTELAERLAVKPGELQRVLALLVDEGSARRIQPDFYLSSECVARAREAIVANCKRHGHLELPQLRDELATTRKFLIPLVEYFDTQGLTTRLGANRVLKRS
jgi:selenocysteine-specific elongation factor